MQFAECHLCHKKYHKDEMFFVEDPYLSEIYPEDGPYEQKWWCDECYSERCMEI